MAVNLHKGHFVSFLVASLDMGISRVMMLVRIEPIQARLLSSIEVRIHSALNFLNLHTEWL